MVMVNKINRVIASYRSFLKKKASKNWRFVCGTKTKNKVLDFFLKNGRWPSRLAKTITEKKLGTRFENFISKESGSYDPHLRRIAIATGRTTNKKRKHDVQGFKQEILNFIEEHGRCPMRDQTIEGEYNLRQKLDWYTLTKNDMTFLGKVYAADVCHKSGIPSVYRPLINAALDVDKPLIRIV